MEDTFKGTKYRAEWEKRSGRKIGFRGWEGGDFWEINFMTF
jgi:hypothetical protein